MRPRARLSPSTRTRQTEVAENAQESVVGVIDELSVIELDEVARCACTLDDGNFAAGFDSGEVRVYGCDGVVIDSVVLGSRTVAVASLGGSLVTGSSIGGARAFHNQPLWEHPLESGCETLATSSYGVVAADSSGRLIAIADDGSEAAQAEFGHVTLLACSPEGVCAAALEDGRLLLLAPDLAVLHDSPAAEDDVETVSCLAFRPDGTLLAARNSLGMTVDDRFENRLECWHPGVGLLNVSELPSVATSLLPTESGAIVGGFDGSILSFEIGELDHSPIAQLDYQVSEIVQWGPDILVASWFDVFRITPGGEVVWHYEHIGVVEHVLDLGERAALMGDDRKGGSPAPLVIIDPDSPPRHDDLPIEEEAAADSEGHSGALSEDEIRQVEQRPSTHHEAESILGTLHEEAEIEIGEPVVEVDLLDDLSASARAINLPPVADAGEDVTLNADDEGKATALLDGTRSYDPDGSIVGWSWADGAGRVIGDAPQVRVRLSAGVHVFYLTVTDDRAASSSSTITVRIR